MTAPLGLGVIGCGNISSTYFRLAPLFQDIEMRACADLNAATAQAQAEAFNIAAVSVDDLLARDDIDIVVNLTVPAAHRAVCEAALEAGKHVYSEKPFVLSRNDGDAILQKAGAAGLRVGSAPDTFLGASHQQARKLIDDGAIGRVTSGTAVIMGPGMEHWHPNPDFFFQPGAGPVLDMGPYYISNLVQLLGPVAAVQAVTSTPRASRTIGSGDRVGEDVAVHTPTTIHALLEFRSGAVITLLASWDVWSHNHSHLELYGEGGTLTLPDPNFFGGDLTLTQHRDAISLPPWDHPFAALNDDSRANYRTIGIADMARAILDDRPHRCSGAFAHHVVDVMTSILKAGETGRRIDISTTCDRPDPLNGAEARALMVTAQQEA
ncbi:MAG: Gfo/Idh/MocA family oxidoreductase [Pseudomonadota bacterium]